MLPLATTELHDTIRDVEEHSVPDHARTGYRRFSAVSLLGLFVILEASCHLLWLLWLSPPLNSQVYDHWDGNPRKLQQEMSHATRTTYKPHVVWQRPAGLSGTYVNTNSLGFRGSEFSPQKAPGLFRIIVLGGSVVWGSGVGDSESIPAHMQRLLRDQGFSHVQVINAGESGYIMRQERLLLTTQLYRYSPDWIVLLDGYNDVGAAGSGGIGEPVDIGRLAYLVERPVAGGARRVIRGLLRPIAIARVMDSIHKNLNANRHGAGDAREDRQAKIDALLAHMDEERNMIQRFCDARSTGATFFLQPHLFYRKAPSDEEADSLRAFRNSIPVSMGALQREAYAAIEASINEAEPPLHSLAGLFESDAHTIYLDPCHFGPEGYQRLAEAMVETLLKQPDFRYRLSATKVDSDNGVEEQR
jgi:lysophospholipase L1-like esterase